MTVIIIVTVLALGLILLFTEVAIVPGFGVAGVLGVMALGAGAVAAWTELGPFWGGITAGVSVVAAVGMLFWLPRSRAARRVVLDHSQANAVSQTDKSALVGRRGEVARVDRAHGGAAQDVEPDRMAEDPRKLLDQVADDARLR